MLEFRIQERRLKRTFNILNVKVFQERLNLSSYKKIIFDEFFLIPLKKNDFDYIEKITEHGVKIFFVGTQIKSINTDLFEFMKENLP